MLIIFLFNIVIMDPKKKAKDEMNVDSIIDKLLFVKG